MPSSVETHNSFDAGVGFLGSFSGGGAGPDERAQMIYFDANAIGWADDTQTFPMDTTDAIHTDRLEVDGGGNASLFVDGQIALFRPNYTTDGSVAFGDQTNDVGVDGTYEIDHVSIPCD